MSILLTAEKIDKTQIPNLFGIETLQAKGAKDGPFKILVPRELRRNDIAGSNVTHGRMNPIAVYDDGGSLGVSLQIQATLLKYEITAAHWLEGYVRSMSWHIKEIGHKNARTASIEFVMDIDNNSMVNIAVAYVRSNVLYLIQGTTPEKIVESISPLLAVAVRSFDPSQTINPNHIEKLVRLSFADQYQITVPESWTGDYVPDAPMGKQAYDFRRSNNSGAVSGWLRVKSVDQSLGLDLNEMLASSIEEIRSAGVNIDELISEKSVRVDPPFNSAKRYHYSSHVGEGGSELSVSIIVISTPISLLSIFVVGPSMKSNFFDWAINNRAWEICFTMLQLLK